MVTVEFFGIPRARAGVAKSMADAETLGDLLAVLASQFPQLNETCIDGRQLKAGYTANLGGQRFMTDPSARLNDGDTVLILSLDAGG